MQAEFFWDRISSRYDSQVKKYRQTYWDTIERTKKHLKSDDFVLDFACGTGITTIPISGFVKEIHAIDVSGRMISMAKEKAVIGGIDNIRFFKTDLFNAGFDIESFDVVLAFNILYFLRKVPENLNRIFELLKPGGLFISATDCLGEKKSFSHRIKQLLGSVGILPFMAMYSISALTKSITDAGFKLIETANLYDNPPNYFIVAKRMPNQKSEVGSKEKEGAEPV